jgi:hypothetical protein
MKTEYTEQSIHNSKNTWDNVAKYGTSGKATDENIIRRMRSTFWIPKATDTHAEYVIIIIALSL